VTPIPTFRAGKSFLPATLTNVFAISENHYITIPNTLEQIQCQTEKYCSIRMPFYNVYNIDDCAISSYFNINKTCQMLEVSNQPDFFFTTENKIIYSTRHPTNLIVTCEQEVEQTEKTTIIISDKGTISLPNRCTIHSNGTQLVSSIQNGENIWLYEHLSDQDVPHPNISIIRNILEPFGKIQTKFNPYKETATNSKNIDYYKYALIILSSSFLLITLLSCIVCITYKCTASYQGGVSIHQYTPTHQPSHFESQI